MTELTGVLSNYWHLFLVGGFLLAFAIVFVGAFLPSAWRTRRELARSSEALHAIKTPTGHVVDLDGIAEAMDGATLTKIWKEYVKTLHPQSADDGSGQSRIVQWRATALAETFFTEQALVDTPLQTEFYKHLPGLATGLGIIGTFGGLISGLSQFKVSDKNAVTEVQAQLGQLLSSVSHAFWVSATAIALAMAFTLTEKLVIARLYRRVGQICELIDSLFEVGAGEEYLKRLAEASEISATQAAHIKDSLVTDLKLILDEITNRQIEAQSRQTSQMSGDVGKAISESLGGPMTDIAVAVRGVGASQGEAVNRLLTDVLASFAEEMRRIFGGQMEGMAELLRQTSASMQATAQQFGQLAANMDAAGTGTVEAMGERMNRALEAMEARQNVMNTQMGAFVDQIRALVSESQSESSKKLQEVLAALGTQVSGVVEELRKQAEASAESQGDRQQRFEKSTGDVIGSLSAQTDSLLRQSVETNKSLQNTVALLAAATDKAISGMNSGAEMLYIASSDFAKAGQGVSETMRSSAAAVETIKAASTQLALATTGTKGILDDYGRTRSTFAVMVADLKATVENAKKDASMTSELIGRIEAATTQLAKAQGQSQEYLEGINDVLVEAHEKFAQSVERTLREGNRQFQGELSTAVQLLSGAIKDLGDTVESLPPRKR